MGKQAIKITSVFVEQIISKIKPLTVIVLPGVLDLHEAILSPLLTELTSNFDSYFLDIKDKFQNHGAVEWINANSSISSMQDFANSVQQVDSIIDYKLWTPIVDAWNETEPPSTCLADNISSIQISKTTSMRCLNAVAKAASRLISGEELSEENKNNSIEFLRNVLPPICFRGDNFSVNFMECLENKAKVFIEANEKSINDNQKGDKNSERNKNVVNEVFGKKAPTLSEIKKLKTDKVIVLARHLDFNVPTPTLKNDVKEAREYCSKNLWRLQSL